MAGWQERQENSLRRTPRRTFSNYTRIVNCAEVKGVTRGARRIRNGEIYIAGNEERERERKRRVITKGPRLS